MKKTVIPEISLWKNKDERGLQEYDGSLDLSLSELVDTSLLPSPKRLQAQPKVLQKQNYKITDKNQERRPIVKSTAIIRRKEIKTEIFEDLKSLEIVSTNVRKQPLKTHPNSENRINKHQLSHQQATAGFDPGFCIVPAIVYASRSSRSKENKIPEINLCPSELRADSRCYNLVSIPIKQIETISIENDSNEEADDNVNWSLSPLRIVSTFTTSKPIAVEVGKSRDASQMQRSKSLNDLSEIFDPNMLDEWYQQVYQGLLEQKVGIKISRESKRTLALPEQEKLDSSAIQTRISSALPLPGSNAEVKMAPSEVSSVIVSTSAMSDNRPISPLDDSFKSAPKTTILNTILNPTPELRQVYEQSPTYLLIHSDNLSVKDQKVPVTPDASVETDLIPKLQTEIERQVIKSPIPFKKVAYHLLCCKRYDEALYNISAAIELDSSSAELHWLKHLIYLGLEKPHLALDEISIACSLNPGCIAYLLTKARLQKTCSPSIETGEIYKQICQMQPNNSKLAIERALYSESVNDEIAAIESYKRAFRLDPFNAQAAKKLASFAHEKGSFKEVIDIVTIYLKHNEPTYEDMLMRGWAFMKTDQWDEAYLDLCKAIRFNQLEYHSFFLRGSLLRVRNPPKAIEDLTMAMILGANGSDLMQALSFRAHCYLILQDYEAAKTDYLSVLERDGSNPGTLKNLGLISLKQDVDIVTANSYFTEYVKNHGYDPDGLLLKAETHFRLALPRNSEFFKQNRARDHYDYAIEDITKAIKMFPSDHNLYLSRAKINYTIGDTRNCFSDLRKAFMLLSDSDCNPYQFALIGLILHEYSAMIERLQDMAEITDAFLVLLGRAYLHSGNIKKSYEIFKYLPLYHTERDYFLGLCLFQSKRYDEAYSHLAKALKVRPDNPEATLRLTLCKLQKGKLKALSDLQTVSTLDALESRYTQFESILCKAMFHEYNKNYQVALSNYSSAIKLYPKSPRGYMLRGVLNFKLEQFSDALQDFFTVTRMKPEFHLAFFYRAICHHKLAAYGHAIMDYSVLLLMDKMELVYCCFKNRGLAYWAQKKLESAWPDLEKAMSLAPNDYELALFLGHLLEQCNRHDKSILIYTNLLDTHPRRWKLYVLRGVAFQTLEQYESALIDYNTALEINPQCIESYLKISAIYKIKRDFRQATIELDKCLEVNPKADKAFYARAMIYARFKRYQEALNDLSAAISINADNPEYFVNRGVIYHHLGMQRAALQNYRVCLELDPYNSSALFNAGSLYILSKQVEFAMDCFNALCACAPDGQAYLCRAIVKCQMKDYPGSSNDFEEADRLGCDKFQLSFNRANMYVQSAQYEKCLVEYEKCALLCPEKREMIEKMIAKFAINQDRDHEISREAKKYVLSQYLEKLPNV